MGAHSMQRFKRVKWEFWVRQVARPLSFAQVSSHLLHYRCLQKVIRCYKFSSCCYCFACGLRGILSMISGCTALNETESEVQTKQSSDWTERLCWHTWELFHVMYECFPPRPYQLTCLSWAWNWFFLTLSLFFIILQKPKCSIPPW